jgi:hypothetical protein
MKQQPDGQLERQQKNIRAVMYVKFIRNNLTKAQESNFYTFDVQEISDCLFSSNSAIPQQFVTPISSLCNAKVCCPYWNA